MGRLAVVSAPGALPELGGGLCCQGGIPRAPRTHADLGSQGRWRVPPVCLHVRLPLGDKAGEVHHTQPAPQTVLGQPSLRHVQARVSVAWALASNRCLWALRLFPKPGAQACAGRPHRLAEAPRRPGEDPELGSHPRPQPRHDAQMTKGIVGASPKRLHLEAVTVWVMLRTDPARALAGRQVLA